MRIILFMMITAIAIASCRGRGGYDEPDLSPGVKTICGSSHIFGTNEARISNGACGIDNPVRVQMINGIRLKEPALINCQAAYQLASWVNTTAIPAASKIGEEITEINVMASYSCRTRNHRKGARLSEHSFGNAIDIGGLTFSSGKTVTVLDHYYSGNYGSFFKTLRSGACGPFGTVLGPGSDRHHNNHFHFDIADHGYGPYCK